MANLEKLVEELSALTVLEAAQLSKLLEEKWGVSAAAPVAIAAAPGAAAGAPAAEAKDEFTVVLTGTLVVETKTGTLRVNAGQAVHTPAGEWVRYSTPEPGGAQYVAVCLPAFSIDSVHRDA